jgi:uncharacterized membrane protein
MPEDLRDSAPQPGGTIASWGSRHYYIGGTSFRFASQPPARDCRLTDSPMLYYSLLFLHFIGLALGVGAAFAMFRLTGAARELPTEEGTRFLLRAGVLSKNASSGFALLVLSGIGMMLVRGPAAVFAMGGGAFHLKLTLIVIMTFVFGYSQALGKKAREGGSESVQAKLATVRVVVLALAIGIVASAVAAFR